MHRDNLYNECLTDAEVKILVATIIYKISKVYKKSKSTSKNLNNT